MPADGTENSPVPNLGTPLPRAHIAPKRLAPFNPFIPNVCSPLFTIKYFREGTPVRVFRVFRGSMLRKAPPFQSFQLETSAIPNISTRPPKNLRPFQLFHFVPLCSAKKFSPPDRRPGTARLQLGSIISKARHVVPASAGLVANVGPSKCRLSHASHTSHGLHTFTSSKTPAKSTFCRVRTLYYERIFSEATGRHLATLENCPAYRYLFPLL